VVHLATAGHKLSTGLVLPKPAYALTQGASRVVANENIHAQQHPILEECLQFVSF
jgi:hypothetical protein